MSFNLSTCFADNPIVQTIYTADPAPMVYEDTCYLYTTHDEDVTVNNFYSMNDWRCYSSKDMVNWTDHGSPLSYKTFSWAQGDAWAAQTVYANGKFYMYVPMTRANGGGARVIGVAVSDSPTGPFKDAIGKPLITNNGAQDIDPTVFIDDGGQAYLYWGNGTLYGVKLNKDMTSYSGSIFSSKPSGFIEGPWFYKRGNTYYMVYAGMGSSGENIQYATSSSPTGPWTSKGELMGAQNSYTNHPGVCDFKGNSYMFYHTGGLPGGGSYKRSVCLEQFKYNSDGTIPKISMTKNGPSQVESLNPYVQTEAETICWGSGIETEKCSEGGMDVCNIENGDYIKVKGVDFGTGAESFEARVASAGSGGSIELRLDSPTGTLIGTCTVSGTGGTQKWETKSCTISGASEKHDLYIKFTGSGSNMFNFNWWQFAGVDPLSTPTPKPTPKPTPEPQSAYGQHEAEDFSEMSGIEAETCSEGGQDIGYIENEDYVVYKGINFGNGAKSFEASVASATSGGNIEIRLDSPTGTLVGTCAVAGTGDWQSWTTATCDVSGASGVHDLYLKFTGGESYLFNLNWWKFNPDTSATPTKKVKSVDINGDGYVNMSDVILIALSFGSIEGDSKFVDVCDLNDDGAINMNDVIIIASKFNTVVTKTETPTSVPTKIPTAIPSSSSGVLPAVSSVEKDGPFAITIDKNAGPTKKGVVVRPASLGTLGVDKHPIFIWGPGGGSDPLYYELLLKRMSSMGFVIYSEASTGDGKEMQAALDWIIAQNSNSSSPYYNKLDTTRIGAGGHSLGCGSAYILASDPRISTTIHCDGGSLDGLGASRMRKPTALLCGLDDNLALGNTDNDYKKATVPIWYGGIKGGGHGAGPFDGIPAVAAWARWQIAGDTQLKSMFIGANATFNTGIWQSQYKNW